MTNEQPQRPPAKISDIIAAARENVASRIGAIRPPEGVQEFGRNVIPTIAWQGVDMVSDAFAAAGAGGGLLWRSFIAVVLAPTILFFLYSSLWQSDRYVSETRVTVRASHDLKKSDSEGATSGAATVFAKMANNGVTSSAQDAFMVLNYVKSRAIVVDLGGRAYLERKFSGSGIDFFSRLSHNSNLEDMWKYWLTHVSASVDTVSGILTVRIDAFRPQDALDIVKDVVRQSEELVNRITLRNRGDAVARAELEVNMSQHRLAEAREKVLQFRNENFIIDPGSRAKSLGDMIGKLTLERIDIVNALSTFSSSLSNDAPSQRLQRTRLAAIDQQISDLKKKLTDSGAADTVSAQIATYERLKLEEQFASQIYTIAQNSYLRARQELEKQQLYLVTIVTPTLPEAAAYPKAAANTLMLFFGLLVSWAVVSLIVASVNDQMV